MEKYRIVISEEAEDDLKKLYKSGRKLDISKVELFFVEIEINPREGTGRPEKLKYQDNEIWSRRINPKDRFIYEIFEDEIMITVVSSLGHYKDK
jgi:toxin YoeB